MKKYPVSLFIFRRDLRIHDNNALNEALKLSDKVLPCFIFDPRQIEKHAYQSKPGLQFMLQCLQDLQGQMQEKGAELAVYQGVPETVIEELVSKLKIRAVFTHRDYTPFSRRRDDALNLLCQKLGIDFYHLADALLTEPEQVLKKDHSPYQVFTAFYNKAQQIPVNLPKPLFSNCFLKLGATDGLYNFDILITKSGQSALAGGRSQALALMDQLERLVKYNDSHDFPALDGTSHFAPYLKFGTCSVREVFDAIQMQLGPDHPLLRQLYWRDFFTHIGYHFPRVFGHAFRQKYDMMVWCTDCDLFQAWADGRTGFPIVDAGMRELNNTGFMHNRVRMITASFLVKDLHISWLWGERYFAQHLVDYDPCVNNGNWQWAASTGCDAQPYFRIFNPWLQQKKFDKDCQYIYQWIPELKEFPAPLIHHWDKKYCQCDYPRPIVDHDQESKLAKQAYKLCGTLLPK